MDIFTHTISGLAAGTVASSFSAKRPASRFGIISLSGFAGAFPDIDAISLWSRFDSTFGELFHLQYTGKDVYSAKLWYSHHGFFHSLVAAILFAALIGLVCYLTRNKFKELKGGNLLKSYQSNCLLLIGFVAGYTIHLLEDMPTPASSWGGVNFLWPTEFYIGGTGQI